MVKETSLLYYPNPQKGFQLTISLMDGSIYSLIEYGKVCKFTVDTQIKVNTIYYSVHKDKSANAMVVRPALYKAGTNVNRIPYPYVDSSKTVNEVKFIVDPKRYIIADGKAKNDFATFIIANQNTNIILEPGEYALSAGENKPNHWDVFFSGKFHNKMFMQNDDCDGYIWEKYCEPNDYVFVDTVRYYNYYYTYTSGILYPSDKVYLKSGGPYDLTFYNMARCKDYVLGYNFFGSGSIDSKTSVKISNNGKDWVEREGPNGTYFMNQTTNKGIVLNNNEPYNVYKVEITDGGKLEYEKIGNVDAWSRLWILNGRLYYAERVTGRPIYALDYDGNTYQTLLTYTGINYHTAEVGSETILFQVNQNPRFMLISNDGFKSNGRDLRNFPLVKSYYNDTYIYKFDGHWFIDYLYGRDQWSGSIYVEMYDYGTTGFADGNTPTLKNSIYNVRVPKVGYKSVDGGSGYTWSPLIWTSPYDSFRMYQSPMDQHIHYFKDGKLVEPYGHRLFLYDGTPRTAPEFRGNNALIMCIEGDLTKAPKYSYAFGSANDYIEEHNINTWPAPT